MVLAFQEAQEQEPRLFLSLELESLDGKEIVVLGAFQGLKLLLGAEFKGRCTPEVNHLLPEGALEEDIFRDNHLCDLVLEIGEYVASRLNAALG